MKIELRISLRIGGKEHEPIFEHRDMDSYVEGVPRPVYPLGFQPMEERA